MSCYHPRYSVMRRSDGQKWDVKYNCLRSESEVDRNQFIYDHSFNFTVEDSDGELLNLESRAVALPCGKCIGCRLDQSRTWAQRCICELKETDGKCYFVTLTYDDEHLPLSSSGVPTLLTKQEFGKHLKRLRAMLSERGLGTFRFYMCAEYGSKYHRPHYHVIFFGLNLPDLIMYDRSKHLSISGILEKWWPYGFHSVGDVTYQSAAYVARYCMKKQGRSWYELHNIVPEWTNMSNRPGIGREYYEKHKDDIYLNDSLYQKVGDKVVPLKPARYFDKLYDLDDHEKCEAIKRARIERGEQATILKVIQRGKGLYDLLRDDEESKAYQIARLQREYENGG